MMLNSKIIFHICFILFFSSLLFSQTVIKEEDYSVFYDKGTVELQFDKPVVLKAFNQASGKEYTIQLQQKKNTYLITNVSPAQIIKLEYLTLSGKKNTLQNSYLASPSTSSGTITVYFNHPVDATYMQTQVPQNLGNTLDDMLINYINLCSNTLDIAIYNSYSPSATTGIANAINAAYTRGVQVRLIYDGSTSSVMIPLLNPMIPILASPTSSSYGIMHNKFVIFDANIVDANKPLVWTGSTNWTVAQIDGPDKNSVIVIQDQSLALGYEIEFEEMWGSTTNTPNTLLSKFGPYKINNTPHSYLIGGKVVNSYFSPSDGTNSKIIAAINSANSDIDIATMLITRSDISAALINKYNSGLTNLNIVLDSQNPASNQLYTLQSGINANQVASYTGSGIMHHKFMCIDNFNSSSDPQVLVGSHNWSTSAETKNDENILIIHDANVTNQYYQAFAYLYQQAGGVLSSNENNITKENIVLYPNPTNGIFYITAKEKSLNDIVVYDVLGNKVLEKHSIGLSNETIDLSGFGVGLYFVDVIDGAKELHYKVIKRT